MTASPHSRTRTRARRSSPRGGVVLAIVVLLQLPLLFAPAFSRSALAEERLKGDVKVSTDGGFARLAFHFEKEVPANIQINYPIMTVAFKRPVAISVDRLNMAAPDYISAARLDPDGMTIRVALARKVKLNATPAAEWIYVDLLPDRWSGAPPGLPRDVIEDLAKRALDAERQLRLQRIATRSVQPTSLRVKVATQPTFTRFVFTLPDLANVVPENGKGKLTLEFDQSIKWDLADARAAMPSTLRSIDAEADDDSVAVTFALNGNPSVRSFREDRSIVVDIGHDGSNAKVAETADVPSPILVPGMPGIAPPQTVPAKDVEAAPAPAAKPAPPVPPAKAADASLAPAKPQDAAPAPASPAPRSAAAAAPVKPVAGNAAATVVAEVMQADDGLHVEFPFTADTPAAAFQRGDTLWLVFDSSAVIDLASLTHDGSHVIRSVAMERGADGEAIVRVRLERPRLMSLQPDSPGWLLTLGDTVAAPSRPLAIARNVAGTNRASIAIPFAQPGKLHTLIDRAIGDRLLVVTALGPARGFLKGQNFVELRALPTLHGVVLQPLADDITVELAVDKIIVARPGGLSLSPLVQQTEAPSGFRSHSFDTQLWAFDRQARFVSRQSELTQIAAMAPAGARKAARFNLARFYLATDMSAEAKAVLDVERADAKGDDDVTGSVLESISDLMLHRPDEAFKELSNARVGNQFDAPVWRAVALADLGRWSEAQASFNNVDSAIASLPVELQRMALRRALRTAIEVRDFAAADRILNEIKALGVPPGMQAELDVLIGRLKQALGRNSDALAMYHAAAASPDRQAAARGRLREILLRYSIGEMPRKDAMAALETLTTIWRGGEVEVEGLKLLAHLYTEDGRYRAAFHEMRNALLVAPNSPDTREIQDEASASFDKLFLGGKADAMPPIEALGLFYDYRDLTPIGWRGDEMIRRLADRLVSVDLLDQAAELLQHQVDHRLQGGARAQVATRLAVIYLMNHKPERAIATLRATRTSELSTELRDQRLLLEARALSETGRHDLALELIANIESHEATRLRSDILWAAKRWRTAGEQIETLYGERWRDFAPLTETERFDILRAAIGYSLGDEPIGLARLRERYMPKMAGTPDARAFDVVSSPVGGVGPEFQDVARKITGVDSLEAFLHDMGKRYPDSAAISLSADAPAAKPEAKPAAEIAPAKAAPAPPAKADATPTGSISQR